MAERPTSDDRGKAAEPKPKVDSKVKVPLPDRVSTDPTRTFR